MGLQVEDIVKLLGEKKAEYLLAHESKTIAKDSLYLPNKNFVENYWKDSNRNIRTLHYLKNSLFKPIY